MYQQREASARVLNTVGRVRVWYAVLILIMVAFGIRLFYLQVIRHDYYKKAALSDQLKEYQIPAQRGIILAHDGSDEVPIVLNQNSYTLFADPTFIKDASGDATKVQAIIGGSASKYAQLMKLDTHYSVLAKKLSQDQSDKLNKLNIKGIGTRAVPERTYPQGDLAAQILGFVDDNGAGQYGVEQALNSTLAGKSGQLKAITDAQGVPLVANKDNVVTQPQNGKQVVLTIDLSMQRQLEDILKGGLDHAISKSGTAIILDANTGQVKAMANYPTYDPAQFYNVSDPSVFNDAAVSSPLEVGSVMKTLTTPAALDVHAITPNETFYDPGSWTIDGAKVTDIEEDGGAGTRSITDILTYSLNTGATWMLMQMGGGQINQKARDIWHDYMVNHFELGKPTGIEQGYEAAGYIPDPDNGTGLNIQYANTAFGQGMTATPIQMAAAVASVVNGGTYYKPYLVDQTIDASGKSTTTKPKVVRTNTVASSVSDSLRTMMEAVVARNNPHALRGGYNVGGKTGTAQIAKPSGGYYDDLYNGTYVGFVGGDKPQYVIVVRVNEPKIPGYAGTQAAAPIFASLSNMLINNFNVLPKS